MKIGIFGGSFNPIHNGHIALARQLLQLAGLDEVWLMVSPQNPLKQQASLLDDHMRYQLACLALHGESGVKASDYEMHLPKPSYTWNTLQQLQQDYPDHEFVLLIGGDNWQLFPHWYRSQDICRHYRIVVYPRRGSFIDTAQLPPNVTMVDTPMIDISSTLIRQRVAEGLSIDGLVPRHIEPLVRRLYADSRQ